MIGWIVIVLTIYAMGGFVWFLFAWTGWVDSYRYPEKRIMYGKRVLATPYWPVALIKSGLSLANRIVTEINDYEKQKEKEQ